MKFSSLLSAVMLALVSSGGDKTCLAADMPINETMEHFVPHETFDSFHKEVFDQKTGSIKGDAGYFVKLYAPWCGFCKNLAPGWKQFHDTMKEKTDKVQVRKADCTREDTRELCVQFETRGYPTVLFLKGNQMWKYQEGSDVKNLTAFAEGGYKNVTSKPIPIYLNAFQKLITNFHDEFPIHYRQAQLQVSRDLLKYGLDKYFPALLWDNLTYRFYTVVAAIAIPILMFLCCCCCCCKKTKIAEKEK